MISVICILDFIYPTDTIVLELPAIPSVGHRFDEDIFLSRSEQADNIAKEVGDRALVVEFIEWRDAGESKIAPYLYFTLED